MTRSRSFVLAVVERWAPRCLASWFTVEPRPPAPALARTAGLQELAQKHLTVRQIWGCPAPRRPLISDQQDNRLPPKTNPSWSFAPRGGVSTEFVGDDRRPREPRVRAGRRTRVPSERHVVAALGTRDVRLRDRGTRVARDHRVDVGRGQGDLCAYPVIDHPDLAGVDATVCA